MLIYKNKDVKVYQTNNLLLILRGDKIEREIYIEDKALLEEELLEFQERQLCYLKTQDS